MNKHIRVVTSLILVVIMTWSSCLVTAVFAADEAVLGDYQFDNNPTLDLPKGVEAQGKWVEVRTENAYKNGKSLRIYSPDAQASAQFPVSMKSDKLVVDAMVRLGDYNAPRILFELVGNDGKRYSPISVSAGGMLTTSDNYRIGQFPKEEWMNMSVIVNLKLRRVNIYQNKKQVGSVLLEGAPTSVTGVRFSTGVNGAASEISVDNLRIYEGMEFLPDSKFPAVTYNQRSLQKTEADYEPDPESNAVHVNEDCNDYVETNLGPWTVINKGMTITAVDEPSAENKSIFISGSGTDPYIDMFFAAIPLGKIVLEAKIRVDDFNGDKALFTLKDSTNAFNSVAAVSTKGEMIAWNNRSLGKIEKEQWYHVAVIMNFEEQTSDYYVDGKLMQEDCPINNKALLDISTLRFQLHSSASESTLYVDDIRMYDGDHIKTTEEIESAQVVLKGIEQFIPEEDIADRLGDAVAMVVGGRYAYANRKKEPVSASPYKEGAAVMVPLRYLVQAYGGEISWDEATSTVAANVNGQNMQLKEGASEYTAGGRVIRVSVPVTVKNGATYVPLDSFASKVLKQNVTLTERGLILLSGDDNTFDAAAEAQDLLNIYNFVYYTRPKRDQITEDFKNTNPNSEHPRVLLRQEDFDRIRAAYDTDYYTKKWVDDVRNWADTYVMDAPLPVYGTVDGLRMTGTSQDVQGRVMACAMLYRLFGEEKYAERAWKELETAANFRDWNHSLHYLDTGEMAAGFGIGYDWLYDYFTPEQRAFLVERTTKNGFEPTINAYNGVGNSIYFVNIENNWNIICNAGVALAALAMYEDVPEIAGEIIERGMESTEFMMSQFFPDGGWFEGVGYWYYQATYLAYYTTALRTTLGTDYGFYDIPGFSKTGYFPIFGTGPTGAFNFHDSAGGFSSSPELFFFALMNNDGDLAKLRLREMEERGIAGLVKDLIWYRPELVSEDVQMPLDQKFGYVEMGTFRSAWDDTDAIFLGLHAGGNDVSHNNVDAGTFVFDALGERWAIELGSEDYNVPDYFGSKRYEYYRIRPEGQNVVALNPSSGLGQEISAFTEITDFVSKPKGAMAVIDMKPAYGDLVKEAKRAYRMDDNRRRVVMQDEFNLKAPTEVLWNMHTKADIYLAEDGKSATLSFGNKKVWIGLDTNIEGAVFGVTDAKPLPTSPNYSGQNPNSGIRKLVVDAKNVTGKPYIAVTFVPIYDVNNAALQTAVYQPIAEWSIPDGEMDIAMADSIMIDGVEIPNYQPNKYSYETLLTVDSESIPQIAATAAENINIEIHQAETIPATATVIVSAKDDPSNKTVYSISYLYAPKLGLPEGMQSYAPAVITCSEEPQPENSKENLADGDVNTRWSAEGIQWAMYEFDEVKKISAIGLAFYMGNERTTKFDLEISLDGKNFTTVFAGSSSGVTDQYESVYFDETEVKYVRIRGYGNSQHAWTSVSEMIVFGK